MEKRKTLLGIALILLKNLATEVCRKHSSETYGVRKVLSTC